MKRAYASSLMVLAILIATASHADQNPIPAPAIGTSFSLPLSDGTTAQALFLPAPAGQTYLVYSTKTGQIGLLTTTTTTPNSPTPEPNPPPVPPAPPTPPQPPVPKSVTVTTVTDTEPARLQPDIAATLATTASTYQAFTVAEVAADTPDPNAMRWIGRTAGKTRPYTFVSRDDDTIIWEGQTPTSSAAWTAALSGETKSNKPEPTCHNGNCHAKRPAPIGAGIIHRKKRQ